MGKDLSKRTDPTKPQWREPASNPAGDKDPASHLKRELMADAVARLLGKDAATAPELAADTRPPRVLLAVANHANSPGWGRAKTLQQEIFAAATGRDLGMKFACWGPDNAAGVRRFRITKRWVTDPDTMAGLMDNAECNCGCFVYVRSVLEQAVQENADRPMRAVIIFADALHDDQDRLDEAALFARQLRREGTQLFLIQQGDDPITARALQYLARVSGGVYFPFDPRTQDEQFVQMWTATSAYAAGGEAAVQAIGGPAATLLLEHLKQEPMPIIEAREYVPVNRDIKK